VKESNGGVSASSRRSLQTTGKQQDAPVEDATPVTLTVARIWPLLHFCNLASFGQKAPAMFDRPRDKKPGAVSRPGTKRNIG
jgi:hypothetical protein